MREEWYHGDNFNWRLFHSWLVLKNSSGDRSRAQWFALFFGELLHEILQRLRHMSIGSAVPSKTKTNRWLFFYLRNAVGIRQRDED